MAASARPLPAGGRPCLPGLQARALSAPSPRPRLSGGRRPGHAAQGPSRQRQRPSLRAAAVGRGRGGGQAPPRCSLAGGLPQNGGRAGAEGPRPSLRRSPCFSPRRGSSGLALPSAMATPPSRSPHSLFTAPDRRLKSGQTAVRPLAAAALASAGPDRASGSDWLARRLFSTAAPDWLSRTPFPGEPLTFHSSSASHPQTRFSPPPSPSSGGTANGGAERGREVGGWAAWWGKAQPMGARRTSPLSSAAPGHPHLGGSRPEPRPTALARESGRPERCGASGGNESPPGSHCGVLGCCQRGPWRVPDGSGYLSRSWV